MKVVRFPVVRGACNCGHTVSACTFEAVQLALVDHVLAVHPGPGFRSLRVEVPK